MKRLAFLLLLIPSLAFGKTYYLDNAAGTTAASFKRSSYADGLTGSPYSQTAGAYITGSEVIGVTTSGSGIPVLVSPIDTTAGWPVVFDWTDVDGATMYNLQVDDNSNFSSPEIDVEIDCQGPCDSGDSTYSVGYGEELAPSTHYYWRVRAFQ